MSQALPGDHLGPGASRSARRRPGDAVARHLAVVETPGSRLQVGRTRARLLLGGGAILAVVVAFALVYLHVVMAQRQFELQRLSSRAAQQQATYAGLRLQVAQLEAPQRIIATAEGTLGMSQPANVIYLLPTSPLPAPAATPLGTGTSSSTSPPARPGTVAAPAGGADWPLIKSQLAGSP